MWVIGALIAMCGTAVYMELGTGLPRSGGEKNYIEFIYRRPQFLATCTYTLYGLITGTAAANSVVFSEYLLHSLSVEPTYRLTRFTAFVCLTFIVFMHGTWLAPWGLRLQNTLGAGKLLILCSIGLMGILSLAGIPGFGVKDGYEVPNNFTWSTFWEGSRGKGANAFVSGLFNVMWSFIGYSNANYALSEIRDPIKTMKRAAPLAMSAVTAVYLLINVAYFAVVSKNDILNSNRIVAALFFRNLFGPATEKVLSAFIALSTLGNLLAGQFSQGRVIQELGREGVVPFAAFFASNKPFGAPLPGLFTQYAVSCVFLLLVPPGDAYLFLISLSSYCMTILNTLVALGLFLLYTKGFRDWAWKPPFRAPRPLILAFFISNIFLLIVPFIPPVPGSKTYQQLPYWAHPIGGFCVSLFGIAYWYVWAVWLPRKKGYRLEREVVTMEDGVTKTRFRRVGGGRGAIPSFLKARENLRQQRFAVFPWVDRSPYFPDGSHMRKSRPRLPGGVHADGGDPSHHKVIAVGFTSFLFASDLHDCAGLLEGPSIAGPAPRKTLSIGLSPLVLFRALYCCVHLESAADSTSRGFLAGFSGTWTMDDLYDQTKESIQRQIQIHGYLHLLAVGECFSYRRLDNDVSEAPTFIPVILFYDHALTLKLEIAHLWTRPKTPSAHWFFINRYFAFFTNISVLILANVTLEHDVKRFFLIIPWLRVLNFILFRLLLGLRVYALYNRSKAHLAYILGSGIVLAGIACYVMFGQKGKVAEVAGCHTGLSKNTTSCIDAVSSGISLAISGLAGAWEALFVFDSILFAFTLYKTLRERRDHRITGININLITLILRDGCLYFASALLIFEAAFQHLRVAMSRMMLNLHQTADEGIYSTHKTNTHFEYTVGDTTYTNRVELDTIWSDAHPRHHDAYLDDPPGIPSTAFGSSSSGSGRSRIARRPGLNLIWLGPHPTLCPLQLFTLKNRLRVHAVVGPSGSRWRSKTIGLPFSGEHKGRDLSDGHTRNTVPRRGNRTAPHLFPLPFVFPFPDCFVRVQMAGQSTTIFGALGARLKSGVRKMKRPSKANETNGPVYEDSEPSCETRHGHGPPPASGLSTTAVFEFSMGDTPKPANSAGRPKRTRAQTPPLTFEKRQTLRMECEPLQCPIDDCDDSLTPSFIDDPFAFHPPVQALVPLFMQLHFTIGLFVTITIIRNTNAISSARSSL
ncbi:hypothetical protein NMY22_g12697 [Coprinellus aureogranulatus]|nr:hypothetical protein NMY22_g12697 [Coprinellus aureogranulatus]